MRALTAQAKVVEAIARDLYAAVAPILHGQPPEVQSAALGDLVSIWLAGHYIEGGDTATGMVATYELREALLLEFVQLIRDLVPESAKQRGLPITYHDGSKQ